MFALLGVGLVLPIWLTVRGALVDSAGGWTTFYLTDLWNDPGAIDGLINSGQIAVCTTLLALLISIPLAIVSTRYIFPGKALANALILAPLVLPPFVGAVGMRHIMGREGALNALLSSLGLGNFDFLGEGGFAAIVLVEALHLYPIIFLNLSAALANIDPAAEEAAEGLGASAFTRLRRVTIPMAKSGLFAGAAIVFVWSFTELGTPLMFEYRRVTAVQIFDGLKDMETSHRPYALTVAMLACAAAVYLTGKWLAGSGTGTVTTRASVRRSERPLTGARGVLALGLFLGVTAAACIPHAGLLLTSLSVQGAWYGTLLPSEWTLANFSEALHHPLAASSIGNSLFLSLAATAVAMGAGLLAARLLVRTRLPGRQLLDVLCMLPIAVPGLVLAFGYVALSLCWPFSGELPDWVVLKPLAWILPTAWFDWLKSAPLAPIGNILGVEPNPFPFLILAYAVRRLPYVVRATVAGLEQTPVELEEAGASAGASRNLVLRRIVIPLVAANLVAGGLLAFSFSMLEVSDSLVLAQRENDYPVTKAIYTLTERLGDGPALASAMGVWAMALLAVALLGASAILGKRMGAVFRA